jgi:hypothetical protein
LILAAGCASDPQWAPCDSCNCVDGVSPIPRWEIVGVLEATKECPRRAITADSRAWLTLYAHYKDGHLFQVGGIAEQPAIFLEAMRIIGFAVGVFDG